MFNIDNRFDFFDEPIDLFKDNELDFSFEKDRRVFKIAENNRSYITLNINNFTDITNFTENEGIIENENDDFAKLLGTFNNVTEISFEYKVFTLSNNNFFSIKLNENEVVNVSGQTEWKKFNAKNDGDLIFDAVFNINEKNINVNDINPFGDGSCVALYPLDGNTYDKTGYNNAIWSGQESYQNGKFGLCANFNGDNYLYANILNNLVFSISFWVCITDTNKGIIFSNYHSSHGPSRGIYKDATDIRFWNRTSGGSWIEGAKYPYELNTWYHIVYNQVDANNVDIFINGKKFTSITGDLLTGFTDKFGFGRYYSYDGYYFKGLIDQVRVFNRALADIEIKELYNENTYTQKVYLKNIKINSVLPYTYEVFDYKTERARFLENIKRDYSICKLNDLFAIRKYTENGEVKWFSINKYKNIFLINDIVIKKFTNTILKNALTFAKLKSSKNFIFERISFMQIPPKRVIIRDFDE